MSEQKAEQPAKRRASKNSSTLSSERHAENIAMVAGDGGGLSFVFFNWDMGIMARMASQGKRFEQPASK